MTTGAVFPCPRTSSGTTSEWPLPFMTEASSRSAAPAASPVTRNWWRASCPASRIWRTCTFQAIATTPLARPDAPSPSRTATAGWLAPAVAAASMLPPRSGADHGWAPPRRTRPVHTRPEHPAGLGVPAEPTTLFKHTIERSENPAVPSIEVISRRPGSWLQRGPDQAQDLLVGEAGRVLRPHPDGALAGREARVAGEELAAALLRPAVDRQAVLPRADVHAPAADLVGGHLVRKDDAGVRVRGEDEPVDAVEQRPVLRCDAVDVVPYPPVHSLIIGAHRLLRTQRRTPLGSTGCRIAAGYLNNAVPDEQANRIPRAAGGPDGQRNHHLIGTRVNDIPIVRLTRSRADDEVQRSAGAGIKPDRAHPRRDRAAVPAYDGQGTGHAEPAGARRRRKLGRGAPPVQYREPSGCRIAGRHCRIRHLAGQTQGERQFTCLRGVKRKRRNPGTARRERLESDGDSHPVAELALQLRGQRRRAGSQADHDGPVSVADADQRVPVSGEPFLDGRPHAGQVPPVVPGGTWPIVGTVRHQPASAGELTPSREWESRGHQTRIRRRLLRAYLLRRAQQGDTGRTEEGSDSTYGEYGIAAGPLVCRPAAVTLLAGNRSVRRSGVHHREDVVGPPAVAVEDVHVGRVHGRHRRERDLTCHRAIERHLDAHRRQQLARHAVDQLAVGPDIRQAAARGGDGLEIVGAARDPVIRGRRPYTGPIRHRPEIG